MTTQINLNTHSGFLRLHQIIGNPKATPPIPPIVPVSRSTFLSWVKSGKVAQPIKLGERSTAWRASDIRALVEQLGGEQ